MFRGNSFTFDDVLPLAHFISGLLLITSFICCQFAGKKRCCVLGFLREECSLTQPFSEALLCLVNVPWQSPFRNMAFKSLV